LGERLEGLGEGLPLIGGRQDRERSQPFAGKIWHRQVVVSRIQVYSDDMVHGLLWKMWGQLHVEGVDFCCCKREAV